MTAPFLKGQTLCLHGLEPEDAQGAYPDWLNDEETCAYLEHHLFPYSKAAAIDYIESLRHRTDRIMLAIVTRDGEKHIGNIALSSISDLHRSAELSLLIGDKESLGKGYATEASRLMLRHGFETMNLNRIWCGTMETNIPMQKLALALGMQQEGIRRQEVFKNGRYYDTIQFSILRSDYDGRQ